jgi:type IV secretory pathway VirB6-like protein
MPQRQLIQAVLVAASAVLFMCADSVIAANCLPAACVADESAAGGVPDGNFANDALVAAATPGDPAAPRTKNEDGPGSAIFNPFASVQDRQKHPPPPLNARAAPLAIALAIALVVTLAGVAAFSFFLRSRDPE